MWVGNFKESKKILTVQRKVFNIKQKYYLELLSIANNFDKFKNKNSFSVKKFAELLDKNWNIKKKLSDQISNTNIDRLYLIAKKNGAIGGKLLGAGSGGFLFLVFLKLEKKKLLKIFKNKDIYLFKPYDKGSEIICKKVYK